MSKQAFRNIPWSIRRKAMKIAAEEAGMCSPEHLWSGPDASGKQECLWCGGTRIIPNASKPKP